MINSLEVLFRAGVISFCVFAFWAMMWPHMIFGFASRIGEELPEFIQKPLYSCPICMVPWWGSLLYLCFFSMPINFFGFIFWAATMLVSMGFNTVILKLFGDD